MDREYLVERRKLSRRVTFWRALTFLIAFVVIVGGGF